MKPEQTWCLRCFMSLSLSFSCVSYRESNSGCCLLVVGPGHQWGMFGYQNTRGILLLSCFVHKSLCGRKERAPTCLSPPPGLGDLVHHLCPCPSLPEATERFPRGWWIFLGGTQSRLTKRSPFPSLLCPLGPLPQCPLVTVVHTEHSSRAMCGYLVSS